MSHFVHSLFKISSAYNSIKLLYKLLYKLICVIVSTYPCIGIRGNNLALYCIQIRLTYLCKYLIFYCATCFVRIKIDLTEVYLLGKRCVGCTNNAKQNIIYTSVCDVIYIGFINCALLFFNMYTFLKED